MITDIIRAAVVGQLAEYRQRAASITDGIGSVFQNSITGAGTSRDKLTHSRIALVPLLTHEERTILFHQYFVARRIVETRPAEAFKKGIPLSSTPPEDAAFMTEEFKRLGVAAKFKEAAIWAANFGGALAVVGLNDGAKADTPLRADKIRSVDWIEVTDCRFATITEWEDDYESRDYGKPRIYTISKPEGGQTQKVHASRCIRFDGPLTDPVFRIATGGWSISIHDLAVQALASFDQAWNSTNQLLATGTQGVFKIQDFAKMVASKEGVADAAIERLKIVDLYRSVLRSVVVDTNEDFEWKTASLTGVPETMDRYQGLIAMVSKIPITVLFGQSPAGLNATGESDLRLFYGETESWFADEIQPRAEKLAGWISTAAQSATTVKIEIPTLWTPTLKERAEIRQANATADAALVAATIFAPEEIAIVRSAPGGDIAPITLTPEALEARRRALAEVYSGQAAALTGETPPPDAAPPEVAPVDDETDPLEAAPPEPEGDSLGLVSSRELAQRMTDLEVEACSHGKKNRCPICAVVRVQSPERDASGAVTWPIRWVAAEDWQRAAPTTSEESTDE